MNNKPHTVNNPNRYNRRHPSAYTKENQSTKKKHNENQFLRKTGRI